MSSDDSSTVEVLKLHPEAPGLLFSQKFPSWQSVTPMIYVNILLTAILFFVVLNNGKNDPDNVFGRLLFSNIVIGVVLAISKWIGQSTADEQPNPNKVPINSETIFRNHVGLFPVLFWIALLPLLYASGCFVESSKFLSLGKSFIHIGLAITGSLVFFSYICVNTFIQDKE